MVKTGGGLWALQEEPIPYSSKMVPKNSPKALKQRLNQSIQFNARELLWSEEIPREVPRIGRLSQQPDKTFQEKALLPARRNDDSSGVSVSTYKNPLQHSSENQCSPLYAASSGSFMLGLVSPENDHEQKTQPNTIGDHSQQMGTASRRIFVMRLQFGSSIQQLAARVAISSAGNWHVLARLSSRWPAVADEPVSGLRCVSCDK